MKNPLIIKSKSKWSYPNLNHPTDKLQIKLLLNEKIKGKRIVGLEAKINPGDVHQLHRHNNEFVIVYSTNGKCKVTMENQTRIVHPRTMIFIPPKVSHRFENCFKEKWEGVAFAIGSNSKIENVWME